jgi:hypothetical protein
LSSLAVSSQPSAVSRIVGKPLFLLDYASGLGWRAGYKVSLTFRGRFRQAPPGDQELKADG